MEREQGLVGEVSVVYLVTDEAATNGEDFVVDSLNVRREDKERGEEEGRERLRVRPKEGRKDGGRGRWALDQLCLAPLVVRCICPHTNTPRS